MIKIAHRGNIVGPQRDRENTIDYVEHALAQKLIVEVDIWVVNGKFYMTHDRVIDETTEVEYRWLVMNYHQLVIHCKNSYALAFFLKQWGQFHFFWHDTDDYALTSRNWVWAYPDKPALPDFDGIQIAVMPSEDFDISKFTGVCCDNLTRYEKW